MSTLGVAKRSDNKGLIGTAWCHLARVHIVTAKYDQAMKAREEALQIFKEIGDKREESIAITVGAEVHFAKQEFQKCIDIANAGLELAKKCVDARAEAYAVVVLNYVYTIVRPSEGMMMMEDTSGGGGGAEASAAAAELAPYAGPTADSLRPQLQEMALNLLGSDEVAADAPLMDSGLDSLSMVQFRNTLQQTFQGVPMPASLVFDHPSVSAIADYIAGELKDQYYRAG